ncbi:MAG TPA: chaperone modulator CbpM [Chitinophagaceae bacterium]|jgi:chaperone modulatory protein CbpM|nr:chaperone modulator CbpM [Chitinophagaceae bacterium]
MDNTDMVMLDDFCASHHVEISFIHSLEESGLIETVVINEALCVTSNDLPKLEQITRLHQDLNINPEGIGAVTHLLRHIEEMKQEIAQLRNRLSFYEGEEP